MSTRGSPSELRRATCLNLRESDSAENVKDALGNADDLPKSVVADYVSFGQWLISSCGHVGLGD